MNLKLFLAVLTGSLVCVAFGQQSGSASNERTLKVTVNYTGSGTVDASHPIYVVLWDSPDFVKPGSEARPITLQPTDSKTGSVTVSVTQSPVYVSTAFDPKGEWKAQSSPPSGTSLGLYMKEVGKAAPVEIKPGQSASIEVPFDDSIKMP
jgi:hypothetical protein